MKKLMLFGLVTSLALSACGKKNTSPVAPPPVPAPILEKSLAGSWSTKCVETADGSLVQTLNFRVDVLAFTQLEYSDKQCKVQAKKREFYAVVNVTKIDDAVMTHRVDHVEPSGAVRYSWVLRMENADQFLSSEASFLQTRQTSAYNQTFYRK